MQKDGSSTRSFFAGQLLLFCAALVTLAGPPLPAQEIHVKVLNARNGKPEARACLSITFPTWHDPTDMWAGTNREGVAVLHFVNNQLVAETRCHSWKKESYFPSGVDTIAVQSVFLVNCQELGPGLDKSLSVIPAALRHPTYSIRRILESGITASNVCGKARAQAKPGELILFARPASLLEKLRE